MKKRTILILILLLIFVLLVEGVLIWQKKDKKVKNNLPTDSTVTERISCSKEGDYVYEAANLSYRIVEDYSFYIGTDNAISPDIYRQTCYFKNLNDLNYYYSYVTNELNWIPENIVQDNSTLSLSYTLSTIQGNYEYYEESYLHELEQSGYTCQKINLTAEDQD